MASTMAATPDLQKANVYAKQKAQLGQIRKDLLLNAAASGEWDTQTVKTISSTQQLTKALQQQKLTFREWSKARRDGTMDAAIREQQALQNAFATRTTNSAFGKSTVDLFSPKQLTSDLVDARVKLGMFSQALTSSSTQLQNWGKNTQWAGRQLMVGFTVPLGIAALGLGKLAYEVDQNLTRIAKVYDTSSTNQAAKERELAVLRENSLSTATAAAKEYGAAMSDILDVQAQLASTGLTGTNLQKTTQEVARISFLGDLDYQQAIDMTIALQTAFGLSIDELTEKFNFMNSVENATSLTIQDIAEATPRAASALSGLGVTVEEMSVLLVSMKESGIDAAEGANALKSATTRLINPTRGAINLFKSLKSATTGVGIDIEALVKSTGGNLFETLKKLGAEMADLDPLAKQQAIAELFGTYQFNRLNASLTNLGDALGGVGDQSNQTAKAIEVAGLSASSWASTAASEVSKMQQSVSGRFKIAVESIKAELYPLGEIVLQILTPIIEGLANVVKWFNSWSDASQRIALGILGLIALAGPLVMLIGLVGNLLGSVGKGFGALGRMMTKFSPMNAEQKAAALMAQRTSSIWDEQASSAAILSQSIDALTRSMERNAAAQGLMVTQDGRIGQRQIVQNSRGQNVYAAGSVNEAGKKVGGRGISAADAALFAQMKQDTNSMAQNSEKIKRNWGAIAVGVGSLAIGAISMKSMLDGSGGIMDNLINAAMVAASLSGLGLSFKGIGGILTKALSPLNNLISGTRLGAIGSRISNGLAKPFNSVAATLNGRTGIMGGLGKMGGAVGRVIPMALRLFGPIGIIAGAVGILTAVIGKMDDLEERQDAVNKSAQNWAEILGYAYQESALVSDKSNETNDMAARVDDVKALREANGDLVDSLKEAAAAGDNFESLYKAAMAEALKVVSSGGTVEQARQAFGIALQSATNKENVIDRLLLRFDEVDLSNESEVRAQLMKQINDSMSSIPGDGGSSFFASIFGGDISDEARAAGKKSGQQFADAMQNASSGQERGQLVEDIMGVMKDNFDGEFNTLKNDWSKDFDELGITSIDSLASAWRNNRNELLSSLEPGAQTAVKNFMNKYQEQMDTFWQGFGDEYGLDQDQVDALKKDLADSGLIIDELGISMASTSGSGNLLTNMFDQIAAAARSAGTGVTSFNRATAMANAEQATSALQNAYSATASDMFSEADRLLSDRHSNEIDAINAAGAASAAAIDRQSKASERNFESRQKAMESYWKNAEKSFESRWKNTLKTEETAWDERIDRVEAEADAVSDSFDARIEGIQDTIDAEQKAEDQRKKIFEAEQRRIERMAARFNTNVDFNVALNSGELDEASRIMNNAGAQEGQWTLEDTQRNEEEARAARIETYQAEMDALKEQQDARAAAYDEYLDQLKGQKDAHMEMLRERQEAEREAMQETKEMQQEGLAAAREAESERLAAARQAANDRTQANVESAQRSQEADRRALDMELRALREFIPTNETELREHAARIEEVYRKYGLNLQDQGNAWGAYIGTALSTNVNAASARISNDIAWDAIGQQITARMANGSGVSIADLQFFLKNGRFPAQGTVTGLFDKILGAAQGIGRHSGGVVRHSGGDLGFTQADRVGVQRSANIMPTEVPAILKRGEFVVNERATRKHRDLLEGINGGKVAAHGQTPMISRHDGGGIGEATQMLPGVLGAAISQVTELGASSYLLEGMMAAKAAQEATSGLSGGSFNVGGGVYPPARQGVVSANTAAAVAYIKQRWGLGSGTLGSRPNKSDHPMGKASDTMIPNWQAASGIGLGNEIAGHFVGNPAQFGTKYVIWRDQINSGRGWTPYTHPNGPTNNPTLQHRDHVHVSYLHKGGQAGMEVPSLKVGGEALYDNTLANLHKSEKVLTAPLSNSLERGIKNLEDSSPVTHLTVDLRGATVKDDTYDQLKKLVREVNDEIESNRGRSRKVTT